MRIRLGILLSFLCLVSSDSWADRGKLLSPIHVAGGLNQLTKGVRVGQNRYVRADPTDPFVDLLPNGKVRIYGTGRPGLKNGSYLEFPSIAALRKGADARTGKLLLAPAESGPWDLGVHHWANGQDVLYGGVATPTGRRTVHARWPDDNWTRRIYPYVRDAKGQWVMRDRPLFNPVEKGQAPSMIGHAYGHDFETIVRQTKNGPKEETWLFHEEISRQIKTPSGKRLVTELFARKMLDPFTASTKRVKLLGVGSPAHLGHRANGDFLLEGPRPFEVDLDGQHYHFISFSSSDFASDRYDINFAWRRGDAIGRYTPMTRPAADGGKELIPFAEQLKRRYGLSWVGRADVIPAGDGTLLAVFHGVRKAVHPEVDYSAANPPPGLRFHRDLFVAPLRVTRGPNGTPVIELVHDPAEAGTMAAAAP